MTFRIRSCTPAALLLALLFSAKLQSAEAASRIPFPEGTYAAERKFCTMERFSDRSPEFWHPLPYIDIDDSSITVKGVTGTIRAVEASADSLLVVVSVKEKKRVRLSSLILRRLSPTSFMFDARAYVFCGERLRSPLPRFRGHTEATPSEDAQQ